MSIIYYSKIDSPIDEISFCWIETPEPKLISIKLFDSSGSYTPATDRYVNKFAEKAMKSYNIEYKFIKDNKRQPEFIQLLIREMNEYFYKKKPFEYPLNYLYFENLSEFSQTVLKSLYYISFGELVSYKDLAKKAGSQNAFRAVGSVMNRNPYPLVIPCHRVIKNDKTIGGFAPGTEMKKILLKHENTLKNLFPLHENSI